MNFKKENCVNFPFIDFIPFSEGDKIYLAQKKKLLNGINHFFKKYERRENKEAKKGDEIGWQKKMFLFKY